MAADKKLLMRAGVCLALLAFTVFPPHARSETKNDSTTNQTIKINTFPGSTINLPVWVMADKGFCSQHGLACETVDIPGAPLALQALTGGGLDIGVASTDVTMRAVSQGMHLRIVASEAPKDIFTLDVRRDIPLPHLKDGYPAVMQDLRGLRIGIAGRGSTTEILTDALLLDAGMTGDDVTFVTAGSPATSYPMLLAKQIDGAMMFEPFDTLCVIEKTCVTVVSLPKGEGPPAVRALNSSFLQFVTTDNFIAAHPAAVKAFIAALTEAIAWTKTPGNFENVVNIAKSHMKMGNVANPEAVIREAVKVEVSILDPHVDREGVANFSNFLLKFKMINNPVSAEKMIYAEAP